MATRSFIGFQKHDGSVEGVYCHWDGYPTGVGAILKEHYNLERVPELIALGPLSSLGPRIAPNEGEKHTFKDPAPDVTVAYHRDRGESYEKPSCYADLETARKDIRGLDYVYVCTTSGWMMSHGGSQFSAF